MLLKLLPGVTERELFLAYDVRSRARELGPSMEAAYGNRVEITLDEDALLMACVEMIRSVRDNEV